MELEKWRLKLLDIGKRNRLINFLDTKNSSVSILAPDIEKLFKMLNSENKYEIVTVDKKETKLFSDDDNKINTLEKNLLIEQYRKKLTSKQILMCGIDLETTHGLTMIYRKSKVFLTDKGINVLYVTFGMLHWESKESKEKYISPLVIIPVRLNNKNSIDSFTIQQYEDEVLVNPTLKYKINEEFHLELPEFVENMSLLSYFETVSKVVEKHGWFVSNEMKMGIFSFLKMNMFVDLKDNEQKVLKNPHVLNLLNQRTEPIYNYNNEEDFVFHNIVDADSSQLEAIKDAKRGISFILQGPPGTGKSQTITNIIAESLMDSKKVLFVSEKAAALNIVYQNLVDVGLDEFCLELHSYRSNKKDVIEQFYKTMIQDPKTISQNALNELIKKDKYQLKLDEYAKTLHKKQDLIDLSLYEIFNEYAKYSDFPDTDYFIKNINQKSMHEFEKIQDLLDEYSSYVKDIGYDYRMNDWYGCNLQKINLEMHINIENSLHEIINFYQMVKTFIDEFDDLLVDKIDSLEQLFDFKNELNFIIDFKYSNLLEFDEKAVLDKIKQFVNYQNDSDKIIKEMNLFEKQFKTTIYSIDASKLLSIYQSQFKSPFRFLKKEYHQYQKLINSYSKVGNLSYLKAIECLTKLKQIQIAQEEFKEKTKELVIYLGEDYNSYQTKWQNIIDGLKRILNVENHHISLTKLKNENFYKNKILITRENFQEFDEYFKKCKTSFELLNSVFNQDRINLMNQSIDDIISRLMKCYNKMDELDKWIDFNNLLTKLKVNDLLDFVINSIEKGFDYNEFKEIFDKQFYKQWMYWIIENDSILKEMNRNVHDRILKNYIDKDLLQFEISKAQIIDKLSNERPNLDVSMQGSEAAILTREYQKKRNQLPVRLLLSTISNLAQTLKPCFLMSPLSVSTYLDPEKISFDLVIFDEASQIFPWDALGAIYRGRQIIIVGDSKQMPPTNFFVSGSGESQSDDENFEEEKIDDFESILDFCAGKYPSRYLRWHYRSRNEQLITFSNEKFYNNRLITFPTTYDNLDGFGINYCYVEKATFERTTRTNLLEATKVVDLVIEQLKKFPQRSLGVVTFSEAQQSLVERLLDQRLKEENIEQLFEKLINEPFFVKNLETVQGDERDTIILSVGYAKDKEGKFYHNFGPLNRQGGERRLNVAITRAKCQMIVVSSIDYSDIDLNKTDAEGAKLLKEYLKFAKTNANIDLITTGNLENNEFIGLVKQFVLENGYEVRTNVGCSSYKLDLAVKDSKTKRYALAIECDGTNYYDSKNTRDRERLRSQVLKKMGWKVYRIWSVDWMINNQSEKKRLLAFLENELNHPSKLKNSDQRSDESLSYQFIIDTPKKKIFDYYQLANYSELIKKYEKNHRFDYLVKGILNVEAPISLELLLKKILPIYNRTKITNAVREEFIHQLQKISSPDLLIRNGFLYTSRAILVPLRIPIDDNGKRRLDEICVEELAGGIYTLLKENKVADKKALFKIICSFLRNNRINENNEKYLNQALEYLEKLQFVKLEENIIYVK